MPLKLTRRPRSPFWIMRGTVRGIRVEESTGVADVRAAEEIKAQREAQLLRESIYGRQSTATFAEAALSYLQSGGKERRFLTRVIEHFGTTPLMKIDQTALDKGALKLYPHAAPSTRNRQFFSPASAVLHHAAKRGLCSPPLLARPPVPRDRVRWLTVDEADRLIANCSPHLRPLVIFLLYTGARVGEALWLEWRLVELDREHVSFPATKNGTARGVPLHPRVIAALRRSNRRDGNVFLTDDGQPYGKPERAEDTSAGSRIKTAFGSACRRAGIPLS
ncbi:MAG: site-specific integrase [Hyphomicrobiales bacterium]|nr:site-specific integrase [Hyphomicrobiales bacterium]